MPDAEDSQAPPGLGSEADGDFVERGTEHLQSAAREMLSAARAFLDAVEDLVEDPDRIKELGDMVGTVAQQAARVGRSVFTGETDTARSDREDNLEDLDHGTDGGEPLF